ncbi:hypothetical protein L1049_011012 [Liquidambar formosana]|uniref:Uncharacterized protein n=1 Tax=Liquidambar formosana TaxID=63359 RepID=A0AAP0WZF8_LIQFO
MGKTNYIQYVSVLKAIESGKNICGLILPDETSATITCSRKTILHVATIAGHVEIVKYLADLMEEKELEMPDIGGHTALCAAASNGITEMARFMVRKNSALLSIEDKCGTPLIAASAKGHIDMARYLFSRLSLEDIKKISLDRGARLLSHCIVAKIFDIALKLPVARFAFAPNDAGISSVYVLSQMPTAFPSGNRLVFWQQWIYSCIRVPSVSENRAINIDRQNLTDRGNIIQVNGPDGDFPLRSC